MISLLFFCYFLIFLYITVLSRKNQVTPISFVAFITAVFKEKILYSQGMTLNNITRLNNKSCKNEREITDWANFFSVRRTIKTFLGILGISKKIFHPRFILPWGESFVELKTFKIFLMIFFSSRLGLGALQFVNFLPALG